MGLTFHFADDITGVVVDLGEEGAVTVLAAGFHVGRVQVPALAVGPLELVAVLDLGAFLAEFGLAGFQRCLFGAVGFLTFAFGGDLRLVQGPDLSTCLPDIGGGFCGDVLFGHLILGGKHRGISGAGHISCDSFVPGFLFGFLARRAIEYGSVAFADRQLILFCRRIVERELVRIDFVDHRFFLQRTQRDDGAATAEHIGLLRTPG